MTPPSWTLLIVLVTLTTVMSANFQTPLFNDSVVEIKVVAGQTAILPCTAHNKAGHSIIWMSPKHILMSQDEQIVVTDQRIEVERPFDKDWNMRIQHVRHNDSGEYLCQINTSPVKIKRVYLYVQVPSHILNSESSGDMDVEEGDDVALTCRATGIPLPNITWYRRPLHAVESKDHLNVHGERLVVQNIRRYQSGTYICLAYNDVPPAVSRQMEIKVQYPPVVKLLNTKLGQILGKDTILECSVTSYPLANIHWIKNGFPIERSFKYRIEYYRSELNTVSLTLHIVSIKRTDYGDYTCEATNRMGKDLAAMNLYEYKPLTTPTTVRLTSPTTVTRRPPPSTTYDEYYSPHSDHDERLHNINGDYPQVLSDQDRYPWSKTDLYYYDPDVRMQFREKDYNDDEHSGTTVIIPSGSCAVTVLLLSLALQKFFSS